MRVNPTTDVIDFSVPDAANTDYISYDLTSVSDTAWVFRFKWTPVFVANSDGTQPMFFATVSSSLSIHSTAQDAIGFTAWKSGGTSFRRGIHVDGAAFGDGDGTNMKFGSSANIDGNEWVEIKRNSATSITVTFFSDEYVTERSSITYAGIASTIDTLRYIKFAQRNSDTTTTGQVSGTIDDIQTYLTFKEKMVTLMRYHIYRRL